MPKKQYSKYQQEDRQITLLLWYSALIKNPNKKQSYFFNIALQQYEKDFNTALELIDIF